MKTKLNQKISFMIGIAVIGMLVSFTFIGLKDKKQEKKQESMTTPTYYVDATRGSDSNDGLTVSSAWQTLVRVNSESVSPGSTVLFRRGEIWRGQLMPRSGTAQRSTLYGAWGTGAKPAILGSVNIGKPGDWIQGIEHWSDREGGFEWRNGGPLWRCTMPLDTDVGNLIFNGGASVGFKKWSQRELNEQGDYYYSYAKKQLIIYSTRNPALFYSDIEAALTLANNFWSQAGGNLIPEGPARAMFLFSSYESTGGKGAADPLFVNFAGNDFHLKTGSPCMDSGLDIGITDDFDGALRPAGHGFDIGAYER